MWTVRLLRLGRDVDGGDFCCSAGGTDYWAIVVRGTHLADEIYLYYEQSCLTSATTEHTIGGIVFGREGDDEIQGSCEDDPDEEVDTLNGGEDGDTIFGNAGDDTISGEDGSDTILGGPGGDTIHGNGGLDRIDGGSGADSLYGDADDDTLRGGDGGDYLEGGSSNDTLCGGGDDYTDTLIGNTGDDLLWGADDLDWDAGGTEYDQCDTVADTRLSCEADLTAAPAACSAAW